MTKIKWAIIGAGGIADRRTIPAILKDDNNELVALYDRNKEVSIKIGEKYKVKYYFDLEEMLKNSNCDAVYIGTPVACHYEQAMSALKYGKHVFIEKPICLTMEEGAKLVREFKKAGKQLTVGYMMKYHNLHKKAKELLKKDGIGKVNDVRAQFSCWYPDIQGAWRQKKALGGGGAVMDLAVHAIELIEFLLDEEIADVKAFYGTQTFSYEVEDSAVIIFRTQSGVLGHIDVNFNIPDKASESKLELYGDKGYIICKNTLAQEEKGNLLHLYSPQGEYEALQSRSTDKPQEYKGEDSDLYLKQIKDFTLTISKGETNYFYADRAVQVQSIVEKIYKEN